MDDFFGRQWAKYSNDMKRCMGALMGIVQGVLCDRQLADDEIRFLDSWLQENITFAAEWPGQEIHRRVKAVLADGIITDSERLHLVDTLQRFIGGSFDELASERHVTEMVFDEVEGIVFQAQPFCLTGDFVHGPRGKCEAEITQRGGRVAGNVNKSLRYLIVGGLGSDEWKHGSFGTKIEKAKRYKNDGVPIVILHERTWAAALSR